MKSKKFYGLPALVAGFFALAGSLPVTAGQEPVQQGRICIDLELKPSSKETSASGEFRYKESKNKPNKLSRTEDSSITGTKNRPNRLRQKPARYDENCTEYKNFWDSSIIDKALKSIGKEERNAKNALKYYRDKGYGERAGNGGVSGSN